MADFSLQIRRWFSEYARDLPWRTTTDPYKIWISEIILQQTRVIQGLEYYQRFIKRFPTVRDLAKANQQEVLTYWQGLGYYSRAVNLHTTSKAIVNQYNGVFPKEYEEILKLKGIGEYTAAAICSFAYQLPYPVLDGNVFRVLSRYFNSSTPIDTTVGKKEFKQLLNLIFDVHHPSEFNQAIMELGALVCKPKNPDCLHCAVRKTCASFAMGNQALLPVKSKKIKIQRRYFHYFVFPNHDFIQLEKRDDNDIWKGLYQFPLLEMNKKYPQKEVQEEIQNQTTFKIKKLIFSEKHILTHQHIFISFWEVDSPFKKNGLNKVKLEEIIRYPIPKPIERFLKDFGFLFH